MTQNIKRISYVLAGLVVVTVVFSLSKFNIANAAKENGKQFGKWTVACTPKDEKNTVTDICVLTQQVNITKDDKEQPIAMFQFGYFGENKELKMVQTLPLGVSLEAGTSIISSKKFIVPGKYKTCTQIGCQALAPISDSDLKSLLTNKDNSVAFMSTDGQQINLPLSTEELAKALKYIK